MVSGASPLGRRSSNMYDPANSRISDSPHGRHDRPAVGPSSSAPPPRHHPYHLPAVAPYDYPAVAPRPLHHSPHTGPSDVRLTTPYDRPTVGPLHGSTQLEFPFGPCKPPRHFPSDPTVIPGGPPYDPAAATAAAAARRENDYWRRQMGASTGVPLPVWHDGNFEAIVCPICNREGNHNATDCPFMILATQLDVFMNSSLEELRYRYFYIQRTQGIHGCGVELYDPPWLEVIERSGADAMRLHKDGINLVRITNLAEDSSEPELLYDLLVKYGPVTNTIVFLDLPLGFVNFVREEDAQKAIKELNSSGLGHLTWATESRE